MNRQTGELEVHSLGEWRTITEFGATMGAGPRETRAILREMDFVQPETSSRRDGLHTRMRVCPWVLERGWGRRIQPKMKPPFDAISPEAQEWARARWAAATAAIEERTTGAAREAACALQAFLAWRGQQGMTEALPTMMQVYWLVDHFPLLSQSDIGGILGITQQFVSKSIRERKTRLDRLHEMKTRTWPKGQLISSSYGEHIDGRSISEACF